MRFSHVAIVVLFLACAKDGLAPPRGLSHAVATRSCGPADGPAVAIYLSGLPMSSPEPAPPYLNVSVWQSLNALPGSWSLSPNSSDAVASYYAGGPNGEVAIQGTVTILSVSSDSTITGRIDASFPNAGQIRGGFTAKWVERAMLCG